jgi:mRNA interferase RelE/StbE
MYEVELSSRAAAFLATADLPLARKLARCFRNLEIEPRRHNNIKRLSGPLAGFFRYRVGDWRVVYDIDDDQRRVRVHVIAHRSDVYD